MILDKLKKVFKSKNDENVINENDEIQKDSETSLEENKNENENENFSEEKIDPDAIFVPNLDKSQEIDPSEDLNLLNAKDMQFSEEENEFDDLTSEDAKPNDGIDYDAEIAELLEQDANTSIDDVDYEYINDISVYDTLRNEKEEIIKEINEEINEANNPNNESEQSDKINPIFYILIGTIAILIIAVIAIIAIASSFYNMKNVKQENKPGVISASMYKSNEANYTYVSQKGILNKQEFQLSKILVDSKATLFYFNNKFDVQKYNILLTDNNDNVYGMDLSFIQNMSQSEEESKETVLRFEPLAENVKKIKLSIYDSTTGENIEFNFEFDEGIQKTPVKYIYDQIVGEQKSENSDVNIKIDNAVFSSAGSTINYTLEPTKAGFSIVQDKNKNGSSILLEEVATNIKKLKKYPSTYSFNNGNVILGRMDFGSVQDLNSRIYMTFENLYKSYAINKDLSLNAISGVDKNPITLDVANYRVVLEGLGSFNDKMVLVFHGENKNIPYNKDKPNANRVEVRLDAQIVSSTASGAEIILDGTSQSAEYGTDMIFPINESNRSLVYGLGSNNLSIHIKSILIKTDDAKCEFSLAKAKTMEDEDRLKASNDVIDIFKGRLAYKSGEKIKESIIGFSDELMKTGDILAEYAPQATTEKSKYSVQIISSALKDDKFYAIVQEMWKGINGVKETHFYRTHKVVAKKGDYFWSVIEDNPIK